MLCSAVIDRISFFSYLTCLMGLFLFLSFFTPVNYTKGFTMIIPKVPAMYSDWGHPSMILSALLPPPHTFQTVFSEFHYAMYFCHVSPPTASPAPLPKTVLSLPNSCLL
jgi:hypothetical protein